MAKRSQARRDARRKARQLRAASFAKYADLAVRRTVGKAHAVPLLTLVPARARPSDVRRRNRMRQRRDGTYWWPLRALRLRVQRVRKGPTPQPDPARHEYAPGHETNEQCRHEAAIAAANAMNARDAW